MYHVIGSDQQEYGPITAAQLNQWVTEGRLSGNSPVRPERTGEWQPLESLPEYTGSGINPRIAVLQDSLTTAPRTCPLARASLVMGLLALFGCALTAGLARTLLLFPVLATVLTGIIGMILGMVSSRRIRGNPGLKGRGLAAVGTCVSAITLFLLLPLVVSVKFAPRDLPAEVLHRPHRHTHAAHAVHAVKGAFQSAPLMARCPPSLSAPPACLLRNAEPPRTLKPPKL